MHLDKIVEQEPTFKGSDYVDLAHTAKSAIEFDSADEMANFQFEKLLRQNSGLYKNLCIQLHMVRIKGDGIPNTFTTDRLALSPTGERHPIRNDRNITNATQDLAAMGCR